MVMFFATAIGILGGSLIGLSASRRIIRLFLLQSREALVLRSGYIGLIAVAVPALFVAVAIGGTLGGGLGESIAAYLGVKAVAAGPSVGVAVGLAVFLAAGLLVGALLGALIGRGIAVLLPGP
jgi:hypothetical protein